VRNRIIAIVAWQLPALVTWLIWAYINTKTAVASMAARSAVDLGSILASYLRKDGAIGLAAIAGIVAFLTLSLLVAMVTRPRRQALA
jgi:hypothetical protein